MPFLERRWLVGLLIPRLAIYYGLLKLKCRSCNVADWTRVIPHLRSVNQTPFINAKCLSGSRDQRYCGTRQTKHRSPFTVFPPFDIITVMAIFSMTPTVSLLLLFVLFCSSIFTFCSFYFFYFFILQFGIFFILKYFLLKYSCML